MKAIAFELNDSSMRYEYHRTREGPNWFMCYYKNTAQIRYDPKEAWRTLDKAKFTDTGKALKEWCLSIHEQYNKEEKEGVPNGAPFGREDTSFASEVEKEENGGGSHHHTKMII